MKTVDELVAGARRAVAARAKRYCMVTATRGPSQRDLDTICEAARAHQGRDATSSCAPRSACSPRPRRAACASPASIASTTTSRPAQRHYDQIVIDPHLGRSGRDREAGHATPACETCVGGIVGLGEHEDDLLDLAFALRDLDVDSVPVNFLDPRPGTPLAGRAADRRRPTRCARCACSASSIPRTDLRVAGGREVTLRSLQAMALYPANSIFTQGYLTTGGATPRADHQMILDAGFELELPDGAEILPDPGRGGLGAGAAQADRCRVVQRCGSTRSTPRAAIAARPR